MIEVQQTKKGFIQLSVKSEMTIYTAHEQKKQLLEHLKSAKHIQLDLMDVTEIDCAGIQLLMFLKQEAAERQRELVITQHSRAVVEAIELLNLSTYFGDPIVISADWRSA